MRKGHGPGWPTHRRKRAWRGVTWPKYADDAEERPQTPQSMAGDLVRRGLASAAILGPRKVPRPPRDERGTDR